MGKRGRGRGAKSGGSRGGRGGAQADSGWRKEADRFDNVPSTNDKFETYYKAQQIVPESEWDQFMTKLHEPLPTTFRLTSSREIAPALNEMIKRELVPFLTGLEHEGVPLSPPAPIQWYPQQYAWQLNIPRQAIRKNPQFKKFQSFLVSETEAGNISRQEAVSMLPPLLLDIKPHHYVLDMCAAPGSKSAQLLEALRSPSATSTTPTQESTGLLIANDSDAKRCHLLVHQSLHRIPAAEMMVTNHDATQLPGLRLPVAPGEDGGGKKWKPLLFDRILCDVPCSGDGTLRKNVGIWRDWNVGNGVGLHSLQLRILKRGIDLLKPGGRLVYSTCSMNPMENESVVSAALDAHPEMSLVDVSGSLPLLQRRPGMTTWSVYDNTLSLAEHPGDEPAAKHVPHQKGQKKPWAKSLWPNGKEAERGLDRCWRLYSHVEDTGGFFVAVLEKAATPEKVAKEPVKTDVEAVKTDLATKRTHSEREASPAPEEPEAKKAKADSEPSDKVDEHTPEVSAPEPEAGAEEQAVDFSSLPAEIVGAAPKATQGDFKEEPFIYLSAEDENVKLCIEFFDLIPSFPTEGLLTRNASGVPQRSIYFTSTVVQQLLLGNTYTRMRLISCGTKFFARHGQDHGKDAGAYRCKWRIMNEGLSVLRPFMGPKRIIQANIETLKILMSALNVNISDIKEEAFLTRIAEMEMGSCVIEVQAAGDGISTEQNLVLPFWRSKVSVNLMVEKAEKSALSNRLWGVDVTPHAPGPSKRDLKKAEEAQAAAGITEVKEGEESTAVDSPDVPSIEDGKPEAAEVVVAED